MAGTFTKIFQQKPTEDKGYGPGTRQGFEFKMDDGAITGTIWDGEDISNWRGTPVKILCDRDGKGQLKGVKVGTYNGKITLDLAGKYCAITDRDGGEGATARQVSETAARTAAPASREPSAPARQPTPTPASASRANGNGNGNGRHTLRDVLERQHVCMIAAEKEVRRLLGHPSQKELALNGMTDKALTAAEITCVISLAATCSIAADKIGVWPASVTHQAPAAAPEPAPQAPPPAPVRPPAQQELEPAKEKDDIPF